MTMKFTFDPDKLGTADIGRARGHNCRQHATESQLENKGAWITTAGHHTIQAWDQSKIDKAKALAKRKDAVIAISFVIQIGNQTDWREPPSKKCPEGAPKKPTPADLKKLSIAGKEWAIKEFGAENIVSIELHTDESTPHLHIVITPIAEGRLQAKHWLNGPAALTEIRARAHKVVNAVIPCEYQKGRAGGKPHDKSKSAGAKEEPPGLFSSMLDIARLKKENKDLKERVNQLEQVHFSRKKSLIKESSIIDQLKELDEYKEKAKDAALLKVRYEIAENELNGLRKELAAVKYQLQKTKEVSKLYEQGRDEALDELRDLKEQGKSYDI